MRTPTTISLPEPVLEKLDAKAEELSLTRSATASLLLSKALAGDERRG